MDNFSQYKSLDLLPLWYKISDTTGSHGTQVFGASSRKIQGRTMSAFLDVIEELTLLHNKKQSDYGRAVDPFANVRASEDFGVDAWIGCAIRMNDKMRRLQTAAQGSTLANEGIEDSFMDMAVYSIIGLILYRQQYGKVEQ